MTIRSVTLPAITPTSWELRLPSYPVITNSWGSSAFPEILGSLPSDSQWRLFFENMSDSEALALLLPWRATGMGQWPLSVLPPEIAGGVDSESFRLRLTGTTWTMARAPKKDPVMRGRYNITIELVYELTLSSVYGPGNPVAPKTTDIPLRLMNSSVITVVAIPVTTTRAPRQRTASLLLGLASSQVLGVVSTTTTTSRLGRQREAQEVISLGASLQISVIATR
jgi:hypothetical protein